jgi:hypothetical protein
MASGEMVNNLISELRGFAEYLDGCVDGVRLCMAYQTTSAIDARGWTFCVSAEGFDEKTNRPAIALVVREMEGHTSRAAQEMIERVVILREYDADAIEIMSVLRSPEDGYLLAGHTIFGREITHAHVFIVRKDLKQLPQRHSVRA